MINKILLQFGLYYKYDRLWITKRLTKFIWGIFNFIGIQKFLFVPVVKLIYETKKNYFIKLYSPNTFTFWITLPTVLKI